MASRVIALQNAHWDYIVRMGHGYAIIVQQVQIVKMIIFMVLTIIVKILLVAKALAQTTAQILPHVMINLVEDIGVGRIIHAILLVP